ncbi:MAG: hypothetical protein ABI995_08835, partial [Acidobacteriota bacterium]
ELVILKSRFEIVSEGVEALPGSSSLATFTRTPTGVWFIRELDSDMFTKGDNHWTQTETFSNFKKFNVDSTIQFDQ